MPIGSVINLIPNPVFIAIHLTAFVIGAYFAWRSFDVGSRGLGCAFSLFALAEVSYMTYHVDATTFLFAHTISEVLDLVAFILVFVSVGQRVVAAQRA